MKTLRTFPYKTCSKDIDWYSDARDLYYYGTAFRADWWHVYHIQPCQENAHTSLKTSDVTIFPSSMNFIKDVK